MRRTIVCEPSSPRRCQANRPLAGQCKYEAVEGSQYCAVHSIHQNNRERKTSLRNYQLQRFKERVGELATSDSIIGLREEIGIARMTMEEILNRCQDQNDLFISSGRISDLLIKIEKLVSSCHRLECNTGQMIDKDKAIQLGAAIVDIIAERITDPDLIDQIAEDIMMVIIGEASDIR